MDDGISEAIRPSPHGFDQWRRHQVPHVIVSAENRFKPSPVLDTDQRFGVTLTQRGSYSYFRSLHPKMQGTVVVDR